MNLSEAFILVCVCARVCVCVCVLWNTQATDLVLRKLFHCID